MGGNSANERLKPVGTTVAPSIVSSPGNNAAYQWLNRALSPSGALTGPIEDYDLGNYTNESITYSGLYPVNDIGATGAVYGQADATGLTAYTGNVDKGLHDVDTILAPNAVRNQDTYVGTDPCAGSFDRVALQC